eukprot:1068265-Karenia_brevis.AAC.1
MLAAPKSVGDTSAAVSDVISFSAAISEVAVEVDGPSHLLFGCVDGDADNDVISFNAAISE